MSISYIKERPFLFFIIVLAVSFILFGNTIPGKFVLDDHSVIENRDVLQKFNLIQIFKEPWHAGQPWTGTYRPLTMVSYSINLLFSKSPVGFHILNIVLYALTIVVAFYVLRKFISEKTVFLALAIFIFLPIHVEPVASIVGRKELLGALFSLLALNYFRERKFILSSTIFLVALLSNEVSVGLPLLLGLLLFIEKATWRLYIKWALYYLPSLGIYFLLRYVALGKYAFTGSSVDPIIVPLLGVLFKERFFTSLSYLFLYLQKSIYPINLSPDYFLNQVPIVHNLFSSTQAIIGLVVLIGIIWWFFHSDKETKFAIAFFLASYFIISNLFVSTTGGMAERWWFLPSMGLSLLFAIGLLKLRKRYNLKKLYILSAILIGGWYFLIIFHQNKIWLNDRDFTIYSAKVSPESAWARGNLAAMYFNDRRYVEAKEEILYSLSIYGKNSGALNTLGRIDWKTGHYDEAEEAFKKAIEYDSYGRVKRQLYRTLALLNLDQGKNKQAYLYMLEAVKWPPARGRENIIKIDEVVLSIISKYKDRSQNSYNQAEKEEVSNTIKLLRGF